MCEHSSVKYTMTLDQGVWCPQKAEVRHDMGARLRGGSVRHRVLPMLKHMHGQGPTRRRFQSFCGHFKIGLRIFRDFYI